MKTAAIPATDNEFLIGKILCIGRNYVDHIKELGNETPAFCNPLPTHGAQG